MATVIRFTWQALLVRHGDGDSFHTANALHVVMRIDATSVSTQTGVMPSQSPHSQPAVHGNAASRIRDLRYRACGPHRRQNGLARVRACAGVTTVEFVLMAGPMMLCAMLTLEAMRWQTARAACQVALLDAARAGSTQHLKPLAMAQAFTASITPLFVPPGRHATPRARMQATWRNILRESGEPAWALTVLQPDALAFRRHAVLSRAVPEANGRRTIPNDYLAERQKRSAHPPGSTIFDANTLHLALTYLHRPLWAPVRALVRMAARWAGSAAHRHAMQAGLVPISIDVLLEMHSDPVQWEPRITANDVIDG